MEQLWSARVLLLQHRRHQQESTASRRDAPCCLARPLAIMVRAKAIASVVAQTIRMMRGGPKWLLALLPGWPPPLLLMAAAPVSAT